MSGLLFETGEWTFDILKRTYDAIQEIAVGEMGLDPYPNQVELISSEQMLDAYSSIGMPIFYHHWSFGKRFARDEKLYRKITVLNERRAKQPIRTWARACTIIPEFVGHTFEVHNGNKFLRVFVQEDMVGHKLGEFSPTRTFRGHSGRKAATPGAPA